MYKNCNCNKCHKHMCDMNDDIEELCDNIPNTLDDMDMCECGFDDDNLFPHNPVFGQSYVPWQVMGKTYTPEKGIRMGTIYPELVMPYTPCQSMRENAYLRASNTIGEGCNK